MKKKCMCGEPKTLGVVHRKTKPCYHREKKPGATVLPRSEQETPVLSKN